MVMVSQSYRFWDAAATCMHGLHRHPGLQTLQKRAAVPFEILGSKKGLILGCTIESSYHIYIKYQINLDVGMYRLYHMFASMQVYSSALLSPRLHAEKIRLGQRFEAGLEVPIDPQRG